MQGNNIRVVCWAKGAAVLDQNLAKTASKKNISSVCKRYVTQPLFLFLSHTHTPNTYQMHFSPTYDKFSVFEERSSLFLRSVGSHSFRLALVKMKRPHQQHLLVLFHSCFPLIAIMIVCLVSFSRICNHSSSHWMICFRQLQANA